MSDRTLSEKKQLFSSFVLVGGAGSRMGKQKAPVELAGKKLFEHAASALLSTCIGDITLVGVDADSLVKRSELSLNAIPDSPGDHKSDVRAPIIGVRAALSNSRTAWAVIVACDLPFITAELIRFLAAKVTDDVDAVVPLQADGRPQPLCAFYHAGRCLPVIGRNLETGELKMLDLLNHLKVRYIPFAEIEGLHDSRKMFLNVNDPADLERARHAMRYGCMI